MNKLIEFSMKNTETNMGRFLIQEQQCKYIEYISL